MLCADARARARTHAHTHAHTHTHTAMPAPCRLPCAATSSKLFARLKAKRFNQIFDYLDEGAHGLLDIVGLVRNSTEHMDNLDIEVGAVCAGQPQLERGGKGVCVGVGVGGWVGAGCGWVVRAWAPAP